MQSMSDQSLPIYYPAHNSSRLVSQMAEEEQIRIAKRIGLIQHLPTGTYDGGGSSKKSRECVICMVEFSVGDSIRFLPCMHTYHVKCIDEWLMKSFICPSCLEPVDAALLSTFQWNPTVKLVLHNVIDHPILAEATHRKKNFKRNIQSSDQMRDE